MLIILNSFLMQSNELVKTRDISKLHSSVEALQNKESAVKFFYSCNLSANDKKKKGLYTTRYMLRMTTPL